MLISAFAISRVEKLWAPSSPKRLWALMSYWWINKRQIHLKDSDLGESPTERQLVKNKSDGGWVEKTKGSTALETEQVYPKWNLLKRRSRRRDKVLSCSSLYFWSVFLWCIFVDSIWVVRGRLWSRVFLTNKILVNILFHFHWYNTALESCLLVVCLSLHLSH